jgi:hypothetical protein
VLIALVLAGLLIAAGVTLPRVERYAAANDWWQVLAPTTTPAPPTTPVTAAVPVTTLAAPTVLLSPTSTPGPQPSPDVATVLRLPGPIPTQGDATMAFATGEGPILGTSGPLRRFRVAVERDSGEDADEFAAQVEATLGDRRSWVGNGLRLRRVAKGADSEFTIYLATRDTAQAMCLAAGVDLRIRAVPYTSCRTTGHVVINLDRWWTSAKPYRDADVPLAVYRRYVVNHEVGHQLGYSHEGCPRRGRPAPVMMQQTLSLRGCTPYPWPRRDGRRYAGPVL